MLFPDNLATKPAKGSVIHACFQGAMRKLMRTRTIPWLAATLAVSLCGATAAFGEMSGKEAAATANLAPATGVRVGTSRARRPHWGVVERAVHTRTEKRL